MAQYDGINIKLSSLNFIKPAIKNATQVNLKLSSNMIADSNDETNFLHKLLLTSIKVSKLRKYFVNYLSTNIKSSKTELSITVQYEELGRLLELLMIACLPLMKNVLKPLAKSVLIPLGLTALSSAEDAGFYKKNQFGTYNIDNFKQRNRNTLKIAKSLRESVY